MGITTIVLGVIVIILIYILYVFYVKKTSVLVATAHLKGANTPITALSAAQSTRYAYGIWLYINTWDTSGTKTLFYRDNNINVYLDQTKPTLYCTIAQNPASDQVITITNNFPVQKWVYVIISADDRIIDCYLDGKLVNSNKLKNSALTPANSATAPVNLGQGFDAYVAGFTSWSGPIGPQEAWNSYLSGNGGNSVSRLFTSYNVDVSIKKDNVEQSKFALF
jgi:uncharacterized protein (UPF0333 family)